MRFLGSLSPKQCERKTWESTSTDSGESLICSNTLENNSKPACLIAWDCSDNKMDSSKHLRNCIIRSWEGFAFKRKLVKHEMTSIRQGESVRRLHKNSTTMGYELELKVELDTLSMSMCSAKWKDKLFSTNLLSDLYLQAILAHLRQGRTKAHP